MADRLTVFITGASAGIGAACARAFAAKGDRVILTARSADALDDLAADLNDALGPDTARAIVLDVTDPEAHLAAVRDLPEDWAAIDVAVLNAGLAKGLRPVWENTPAEVDAMVDTNVKGVLNGIRAVVPGMLARGRGHVVPIGSTAGHAVYAGGVVYCATKHAVLALADGLKVDLHGTPLRVTAVSPGLVETDFSLVRFDGDAERADAVYADTVALTPEDVADAVVYCAHAPERVNVHELLLTPRAQSGYTMIARGDAAGR
ncbi:SDR family NAD(P)-dependent oxidoreductase [Rubrivirga sp. IMCC45206]|uniref:SDR family NAD(P)-dependent oxidoreductase n=1 Tax=Rubrivirga sp. IMCC45206 TaxID=3391614 RepID=UPI00398FE4C2